MARMNLLPIALVAGGGLLVVTQSSAHGSFGNWLHSLGGGIVSTAGATASAVGTTTQQATGLNPAASGGSSGTPATAIGGSGVYAGNAGAITAAAHAAGYFDASSAGSLVYGAALWSLQSHEPQPNFYHLPTGDQSTFASVATTGK